MSGEEPSDEDAIHTATIAPWPQAFDIQIGPHERPALIIRQDGSITIGEGYTPTEAAAECIAAMSGIIKEMMRK